MREISNLLKGGDTDFDVSHRVVASIPHSIHNAMSYIVNRGSTQFRSFQGRVGGIDHPVNLGGAPKAVKETTFLVEPTSDDASSRHQPRSLLKLWNLARVFRRLDSCRTAFRSNIEQDKHLIFEGFCAPYDHVDGTYRMVTHALDLRTVSI